MTGLELVRFNDVVETLKVAEARIKELEEELADYKEGVAGMRDAIRDLRDERDNLLATRLLSKSEEVKK